MRIPRRGFLKGLLTLPFACLPGKASGKSGQKSLCLMNRFHIAGFHFYDGPALLSVPRTDNRHISRLLRQGVPLACRAIEVDPEALPWEMVKVEVGLEIKSLDNDTLTV